MKNKAALVFAVVALGAVLGCGRLSELTNKALKTDDTKTAGLPGDGSFTLAGKEWSSYPLENTDVTIDLPGKPNDKTPPLPPSYRAIFSAMNIHAFDEKDFQSSVSQLSPTGARKFTIKELAETSLAAVKKQIPKLTYEVEVRSETNAKLIGSFTRNGAEYHVRGCVVYKKPKPERVWAVLTIFPKDNADAQTASTRMINSVVFKESTERCQ
ncbi:MAG: hypothetical protein ACKVQW_04870 [Pyrinomonadaceae bacterium]